MSTTSESAPSPRQLPPTGWILAGGLLILAAGIGLGFLLDRDRAPHRPGPHPGLAEHERPGPRPAGPMREKMRESFRERREEAREFHGELREWSAPLEKIQDRTLDEIAKVLRPEQKERLAEVRDARSRREGPDGHAGPGPRRQGMPLMDAILIQPRLERLGDLLVLDKEQTKQVEVLLKKQREEVIAWLDSNPPPKPEHKGLHFGGPGMGPRPGQPAGPGPAS